MSTRPHDTAIDTALRALDPAPRAELSAHERERADAMFARLVSSPAPPTAQTAQTGTIRRTRRRVAAIVAAAVAAVVGIAAPTLLGGGGAFASWTPTPDPVSSAELPDVESTCRDNLRAVDKDESVVLAERRGGWIFVLLEGRRSSLYCLLPENLVGTPDGDGGVMGGWSPKDVPDAPRLGPDGLGEAESMTGAFDDDWYTVVQGYVGVDVTGVEVHVSTGLDIEASMAGGRFAAWWPGEPQSSKVPAVAWSYTVTLADGSSREIDPSTIRGE